MGVTVNIGRWVDGTPVELVWPSPHMLIAGTTGSGKSGWISSIVGGLADHPTVMYGVDLKAGLELAPWKPRFAHIAETPNEATQLLTELRADIERRNNLIKANGAKKWLPVFGPSILLVVDELAELGSIPADVLVHAIRSEPGDREVNAAVRRAKDETGWRQTLLASLARISRAAGVTIIVATQYPLASVVGSDLRSNLSARISCRQTSAEGIDITLGSGWRDAIKPSDISLTTPGVAHLFNTAGTLQPRLARAHLITDAAIRKRVAQTSTAMPRN